MSIKTSIYSIPVLFFASFPMAANAFFFMFPFVLLIQPSAYAESAREQMLVASATSRNASFNTFLLQHGKTCTVNESMFNAQLRTDRGNGDLWSVRCIEGSTFAIFIGSDAKSTSWFMPCANVERISNLRCFEQPPQNIVFK